MARRAGIRWRRAAASAVVLAACLAAAPAQAGPPGADPAALDRTVGFLQGTQNADGGFGGVRSAASDPGISAWAALALAAGGINPYDQARPGGVDAATYVLRATRFSVTTDYERVALMAVAAGIPLRDFNGTDLVAGIMRARLPDGSFAHADARGDAVGGVNDTAFAIFALGGVQAPAVRAAVQDAATWLLGVQNRDGGWDHATADPVSSADITGAVIQALRHAGRAGTNAERRGLDFLRRMQLPDGGFQFGMDSPGSNTASTAWGVQGLWAAGVDPSAWELDGRDPLDYLRRMQQPDGEILFREGPGSGTNTIWMTAYCAPAFAGMTWPLAFVPRATTPDPDDGGPGDPAPDGGGRGPDGAGGTLPDGGGQAIAGGGGNGAPLFSRPQPQSRGATPGGVRRIHTGGRRERRRDQAPRRESTPPATAPAASPGPADAGMTTAGAPDRTGGARGIAGSSAGGAGERRADASADPGRGTRVHGRVIEDPRALDRRPGTVLAAAPGLRGARTGGRTGRVVALGIGGSLAVVALLGLGLERGRPALASPTAPTGAFAIRGAR